MHWRGKGRDEPVTRIEAYTKVQECFDRIISRVENISLMLPYMRESMKKEAEVFDCKPCRQVLQTLAEVLNSSRRMAWLALYTMSYIDDIDPWGEPSTPESRHAEWLNKSVRAIEKRDEYRKNAERVGRTVRHRRKRKVRHSGQDVCDSKD